jgi:glycosyltransferase involved in cell wall biosynthesis
VENLLTAYKNVHVSLRCKSSLTIAGSGEQQYTEKLTSQIRRLGLTHSVKLVGHVTGEVREKLFYDSDLVVVPSHAENFCLVVAEALAHGVPVIASQGTPWKRIEEIGCGLWVNNNPDTLAEAIKRITLMPRLEMGRKGREWMQKEFSWNSVTEKMLGVYRDLVQPEAHGTLAPTLD